MPLKLVYRALRQISDWTVYGFYSEVVIEGEENVPRDGPLIIAANHPNEILDVATLSVTVPHRRHVSFWAKSTLFSNAITRSILSSSGAIPVFRNPNSEDGVSNTALFHSSISSLRLGGTIGVFCEGACYTEPTIVQIMSGAAWVAVEYTRQQLAANGRPAVIVPVGLVYTDKATFSSALHVHYGAPISMAEYSEDLLSCPKDDNEVARRVVRHITERVERQLFSMTVNASDWETLHAAETLRAIIYRDTALPLQNWAAVSQHFVNALSNPQPFSNLHDVKVSLIKYYSLLHYADFSHADLPAAPFSAIHLLKLLIPSLSTVILTPLYIPTLALHLPACLAGELAVRLVCDKNKPEIFAEHRSVCGGLGLGLAIAGVLSMLNLEVVFDHLGRSVTSRIATYWAGGWIMFRSHRLLVPGLHRRLRRGIVSCRIILGILFPGPPMDTNPYTAYPPSPPSSKYIRRNGRTAEEFWEKKSIQRDARGAPPRIGGRKLIRAVLQQREEVEMVVKLAQMSRAL